MTEPDETVSSSAASLAESASASEGIALGVARREATALRRFYESHVDGLYAFVMVRVRGDVALAEDVVQDTFLTAMGRVADYDPQRGSLRSWLWTLSRNVLRRHLRHHPQRARLYEVHRQLDAAWTRLGGSVHGSVPSDEILEQRQTRAMVTTAMASLDPKYRRVLVGKYVEDKTLQELGAELELSGEAVKSLLARARRAFRQAFGELAAEARSEGGAR